MAAAEVSLPGQRSADRRLVSVPAQAGEVGGAAWARRFAPCWSVLPQVWVPAEQQWVETTGGRVASDGYSWLQAVHWVVASGCYVPGRSHGPRGMGRTTVCLAQELAQLSPCRPGVEFLAWKVRVTERTVKYHLSMLRESGLLAYIERGTRARGVGARASVFALVIPAAFDDALGVRTTGEGVGRRMVGIADAGRELMARMGEKASRRWRAARPKRTAKASVMAVDGGVDQGAGAVQHPVLQDVSGVSGEDSRCTPMEVGASVYLSDRPSLLPPESRLASGEQDRPTSKTRQAGAVASKPVRKLNAVGRRYQLARELVEQVPWMTRAAVPRIAWIVRHVSDAGWTADQVIAWLELAGACERVRRPSAYLAHRLYGADLVWDSQLKLANGVQAWRDSRRSTADRHVEWHSDWRQPVSAFVHRMIGSTKRQMSVGGEEFGTTWHSEDDPVGNPLRLPWEEVVDLRAAGERDHGLARNAIEAWGEDVARQVYSDRIVDLAQAADRARARSFRMVVHATGWEGR